MTARAPGILSPVRGVVLLVDPDGKVDPEHLRQAGLMVYEAADERMALDRLSDVAADVVVVAEQTVALTELRRHVDHATSIIVIGGSDDPPQGLHAAGADSFLPPSADFVYEIHRALILRRSGRRLPWNR